jgi:hypothetical protein
MKNSRASRYSWRILRQLRVSHLCRSKRRRNDITRAGCRQYETQEPECFQVGAETDAGRQSSDRTVVLHDWQTLLPDLLT